jgi:CheY-like chemotaxis protein/anti-sigma regulatory factor (Ser/Thr protein kinase)
LDISKIEAGKLELSNLDYSFEKMLQNVVNIINFRIEEKRQRFTAQIDSNIPDILFGDDQRLAQVITNLLSNAVKFTPENGLIELNARLLGEEEGLCIIQIRVSDNGIGVDKAQQARLFDSFQQAENDTSRKFGGTGLGLAISKSIVEAMGGTIRIESELGQGASFVFTVRAARGSENSEKPLASGADNLSVSGETGIAPVDMFKGRHALLVEDVEINREIVMALLEPTLLTFDCAKNGFEALKLFSENPEKYDIILMDLQMPEMDGFEATRRIRSSGTANAKSVPIVAMTANVFKEDVENCLASGMNDHVGKPLDFDEVLEKLRSWLPHNAHSS